MITDMVRSLDEGNESTWNRDTAYPIILEALDKAKELIEDNDYYDAYELIDNLAKKIRVLT